MGSYQAKNEEIVIAQQGANDAKQAGDMERKIENMGIIVIVVAITLALLLMCIFGRRSCISIKKWFRKELTSVIPEGSAGQAAPQAQHYSNNPC